MKLNKIGFAIKKKISNLRIEKKGREIAKYLEIDNSAMKQPMYSASEIIANYAKANGVKIYITKAPKRLYSQVIPNKKEGLYLTVEIPATKKKVGRFVSKLISDDINAIFHNQKTNPKTKKTSIYEENFLRYLYRSIENCVDALKY